MTFKNNNNYGQRKQSKSVGREPEKVQYLIIEKYHLGSKKVRNPLGAEILMK